jgi:hypothetical protein
LDQKRNSSRSQIQGQKTTNWIKTQLKYQAQAQLRPLGQLAKWSAIRVLIFTRSRTSTSRSSL